MTDEQLTLVRIDGDGVGPEIVDAAARVVEAAVPGVEWLEAHAGDRALASHGHVAPDETLAALRTVGLGLKGPFHTPSGGSRRSPNHRIRRELDLYANLRPLPIRSAPKPVLLVRENVEDLYAAIEWSPAPGVAEASKIATEHGCTRISRYAFDLALREQRGKVTVVHKANNLKLTEGMFLRVALETAQDHPAIACDDLLVDTAASELILHPEAFDVILTSNTFGDILSNVGAAVAGSLGVVGSLNLGADVAIAEASHGDARQLAGTERVNPIAMIRAAALLLAHVGLREAAASIEDAVDDVLAADVRTLDLGGSATTHEVTDEVIARMGRPASLVPAASGRAGVDGSGTGAPDA
jgi:isocitrate dehydrogenase (NAD+)